MSKNRPTTNEQRSNALNPNNPAHTAAQDNRSRQLNPENEASGVTKGQPPVPTGPTPADPSLPPARLTD